MKLSHTLSSRKTGPRWGVAFGLLTTLAGVALWCVAKLSSSGNRFDEPVAVAALLVGVFAVVYAGHELRRR